MEIGSFISLDLKDTGEYYNGSRFVARLNSARAGIYHACRLYGCTSIHIPHYLCPTVRDFLTNHGIKIKPYFINSLLEPKNLNQVHGAALLLVNYFGIFSDQKLKTLAGRFDKVIIDNSAAFFCKPLDGFLNVYSPRKFFGVPDGCYVIGQNASKFVSGYRQDYSSDTSGYLMKRIEYRLERTYGERMTNEKRIDQSDILRMSILTRTLLKSIDYMKAKKARQTNFNTAHYLYQDLNLIDPTIHYDEECVPMVYPLVIENADIISGLRTKKVYAGRLWNHILQELGAGTVECWLSTYLVPIPIDQRYTEKEINYVYKIITDLINR